MLTKLSFLRYSKMVAMCTQPSIRYSKMVAMCTQPSITTLFNGIEADRS